MKQNNFDSKKMSTIAASAFIFLISGFLSIRLQAEDKFEWVPPEAKNTDMNGASSKAQIVLPLRFTKIPKATANMEKYTKKLVIDLLKYGISNDASNAEATSKGINQALADAKAQGNNLIIFPKGTYTISEKDPIIFDLQDAIVDLNGATLQINPTADGKSEIAIISYGAKNFRLTNGTMKGNLFTRPDKTQKPKADGGGGTLRFKSGQDIEVDHMNFTEATGFCVTSSKGMDKLRENGYRAVLAKNLESGGFSEKGLPVPNPKQCRTIKPFDLLGDGKKESSFDGEFEFGYIFGYGSFQSIFDRNYQACYYDKDMNFIKKMQYIQYKKNQIPPDAQFLHLEFNQASAEAATSGMVGSISNMRAPVDVHFHHNRMYNTGSLGFAYCGGQRWIMEDNMFEKCGGTAPPHYGIDFEDGWDLMQDVVFRNNKFKDNLVGDLVVCAGSEMLFEGNVFEKGAHVWGRTHNYTFKDNTFNSLAGFMSRTGVATITGNTFKGDVKIEFDAKGGNDGLGHEKGMIVETPAIKLDNNTFMNAGKITGTYFDLVDCKIDNSSFYAGKDTRYIHFKNCVFNNSKLVYEANGPNLAVEIENCKGELKEEGPGLQRKNVKF